MTHIARRPFPVVINCASGPGPAVFEERREQLEALWQQHGLDARPLWVEGEEVGEALATARAQAEEWESHMVVVGGGDGTLRTAAQHFADSTIVVGILPLGTFNQFALDLGVDTLERAVAAIDQGWSQSIDVGEVNDHLFLNHATLGLHPVVNRLRQRYQRWGWSRRWAAFVAAYRVLWRPRTMSLQMRDESSEEERVQRLKTSFLMIGNNAYETKPPMQLHRPALDKGELNLLYLQPRRGWAMVRIALQVAMQPFSQVQELHRLSVKQLTIKLRKRRVKMAVDGELMLLDTPLSVRCRPGALRIVTPLAVAPADEPSGSAAASDEPPLVASPQ